MDYKKVLLDRLSGREARIGVIGMGYVGLPIALHFAHAGLQAVGFDIDKTKVDSLNKGKSYIKHIPSKDIALHRKGGRFSATCDFSKLTECDVIIIAVPTPLTEKKEPDLTYVSESAKTVARYLRPGQAVSLESTTYPGTTRELLLSRFESAKMKVGRDYFLVYSPEREDPGNERYKIHDIPKVVGGITPACSVVGAAVYGSIVSKVVPVTSTEAAELTKLLENIFRSVNIALVNELKMLCDRIGIDIWEVITASSTKPFGFMPFYPGPGLGGHCIPIDPFYLSWKAKEYDFSVRFIELAGEINTNIPYWVVGKLSEHLNERKKCLNGSKILLIGAAYKKNVDDVRESPSLVLINLLKQAGAQVSYHDPYVPELYATRHFKHNMTSRPLTPATLKSYDAVVIVTDHDDVDYRLVANHAKLVLDTRNAMSRLGLPRKNVRKA